MGIVQNLQWLTTKPSGRSHTHGADDGQTGWRVHAVISDPSEKFSGIGRRPSLCGLRPRKGWGMDLFIDEKCKNCLKALERQNVG